MVKDRNNAGRFAIGAQHKLAGLTGAAYAFQTVKHLARARGNVPVKGIVTIEVTKDRPGHVRGYAKDAEQVGNLEITSYPDGHVEARIIPPPVKPEADMILVQRILVFLSRYDGSSFRKIEDNVTGNAAKRREALTWMVEARWVDVKPSGRSHLHYLTSEGRSHLLLQDDGGGEDLISAA